MKTTADTIAKYMHKDMLIVLESTTYPGTTEELLKASFGKDGESVALISFWPFLLNVDPGNRVYKTKNTPKVVGGVTRACTDLSRAL